MSVSVTPQQRALFEQGIRDLVVGSGGVSVNHNTIGHWHWGNAPDDRLDVSVDRRGFVGGRGYFMVRLAVGGQGKAWVHTLGYDLTPDVEGMVKVGGRALDTLLEMANEELAQCPPC